MLDFIYPSTDVTLYSTLPDKYITIPIKESRILIRRKYMAIFKQTVIITVKGNAIICGSIIATEIYVIATEALPVCCISTIQNGNKSRSSIP